MTEFSSKKVLPIAISMGEPAGIGPDLILQSYFHREKFGLAPFYVHGNIHFLRERAKRLGLKIEIQAFDREHVITHFASALPVFHVESAAFADSPAHIQNESGACVIQSIENCVHDIYTGHARAMVSAPIHKAALAQANFDFPGHTEFLAYLAHKYWGQPCHPVMMIWSRTLAVVPLTIHMALADVSKHLTKELIVEVCQCVHNAYQGAFAKYQKFEAPRLAVCGLNPHAGENGLFGRQEIDVIAPALAHLQSMGLDVRGPFSADTLFHERARAQYDVCIGMYHDQVLIPAKTLAFDSGVNCTLGLPFVRTSPDHGTAFDHAGKGTANMTSFVEAMKLADELSH